MLKDFDDALVDEYIDSLKSQARKTKIRVLLLGPDTKSKSSAAKLRRFIHDKCTGDRISVLGEREDLITAFSKVIGRYANLCSYEQYLARKLEAMIITQASAGSFAELGMFSLEDDIHPKTLVLFDKKHVNNDKKTFITLGPNISYRISGATVKPADYDNLALVWEIVNDFLEKRKAIKFSNSRRGFR